MNFIIDFIKTNYKRELNEKKLIDVSFNCIFLDSSNTEKTIIIKLYDWILTDIEMLNNDENQFTLNIKTLCLLIMNVQVVVKNSFNFIDNVIKQLKFNTKVILAMIVEKILIINEIYMLYSDFNSESKSNIDIYKIIIINMIVADVQSVSDNDCCILLLEYEAQMMNMFQNVNFDLTWWFQLLNAFQFKNFSNFELQKIFQLKLMNQNLKAIQQVIFIIIDVLNHFWNELNFDNDDDVKNLISKVKANYQTQQSVLSIAQKFINFIFKLQNFNIDFDQAFDIEINLQELFKDVINCKNIIIKLNEFLKIIKKMRAQDLESHEQIFMNFIFKKSFDNQKIFFTLCFKHFNSVH